MFTKSKIAAVALISSCVVASSVNAKDISLEGYVSGMVNQAMVVAQQEIKNTVHESILNVAYNVSLDESKSYNTNVSINDITVKSVEASTSKPE